MKKTVYIGVNHANFWWGVYGLCDKTSWEDLTIYEMRNGGLEEIAWTCVCTKPFFTSSIEDLENDPDEAVFVKAVNEFLSSDNIVYKYYYRKPSDENFYEVSYEAKRNADNIKPSSIETWYPSDGVGLEEAEHCTIVFCRKFLCMDISEVLFNEVTSMEEAMESYISHMEMLNNCTGMVFADELVQQLSEEWNKSNEKVLEILNRSLK